MIYLETSDLKDLYTESRKQATIWREDYPAYERLADNGLMEGLDSSLPEVNDGSLAASLFKLPKRIVSSSLSGRAKALDRDDAWLTELANLQWENEIIPNANSMAPFHRKWKDAVRKAAIYGGVPLITLFVNRGDYTGADFIVAQPQDVTLEPGKVSDYDSDVIFWDVFYTKLQLKNLIQQAKDEKTEAKTEGREDYNKWNVKDLEKILKSHQDEESRDGNDVPYSEQEDGVRKTGIKFCVAFQRGVNAPFYMYHRATNSTVREWSNPDPTGDIPVHYLYCYQDFINPYGIGIVKLAGGTQNVLDYMRQADVLATQLGLRPPIEVAGDADSADLDSMVYAQDALWFTGNARVKRQEMSNGIYQQLPDRMAMYKTSLNQLIPTGDTSISAGSGDPNYSKTPAGVKFQAASLSIDDEDFKDNLYLTYAAVAKSMINTHFANMDGTDLMKLNDDERELLTKAGLGFPENEAGEMSNQVEVVWDEARATFDFEVDPEMDKTKDDEQKLEGLMKVAELTAADPTLPQELAMSGKKLNKGELFSEIIKLTSDNDKIITEISPEEMADQQVQQEQMMQQEALGGKPMDPMGQPEQPMPQMAQPEMGAEQGMSDEEIATNLQNVMVTYGVDENVAAAALEAEMQGTPVEDIITALQEANR